MEIKLCTRSDLNKHFDYSIPCLICNESILLDDFVTRYGRDVAPKICDKCKRAVMQMRKKLEENNE